mgnify:CR=1 FL=1
MKRAGNWLSKHGKCCSNCRDCCNVERENDRATRYIIISIVRSPRFVPLSSPSEDSIGEAFFEIEQPRGVARVKIRQGLSKRWSGCCQRGLLPLLLFHFHFSSVVPLFSRFSSFHYLAQIRFTRVSLASQLPRERLSKLFRSIYYVRCTKRFQTLLMLYN